MIKKDSKHTTSNFLAGLSCIEENDPQPIGRSNYRIADLQRKLQMFGGMHDIEEDVLNQINSNTQRLDDLISKVRVVMKIQGKDKRQKSLSKQSLVIHSHHQQYQRQRPNQQYGTTANLTTANGKTSRQKPYEQFKESENQSSYIKEQPMRLKDRVQKALEEKSTNPTKPLKYLKSK